MNNLDIHKLLPKPSHFTVHLIPNYTARLYCENQTHAYLQAQQSTHFYLEGVTQRREVVVKYQKQMN